MEEIYIFLAILDGQSIGLRAVWVCFPLWPRVAVLRRAHGFRSPPGEEIAGSRLPSQTTYRKCSQENAERNNGPIGNATLCQDPACLGSWHLRTFLFAILTVSACHSNRPPGFLSILASALMSRYLKACHAPSRHYSTSTGASGLELSRHSVSWLQRDVLLFAASIGCKYPQELRFLYVRIQIPFSKRKPP